MICGCIDIGSNTTRLLVADGANGTLRELVARRSFTRIGSSLRGEGRIPPAKIEEVVGVVVGQADLARDLGVAEVVAVATAAIRDARNRDELVAAVESRLGTPLRVLTGAEEARLSFLGATRTLADPIEGSVAVLDVGGGSTEIAIGSPGGPVEWWESVAVGSGALADRFLGSDPVSPAELAAARGHLDELLSALAPPPAVAAVAVGGTATSLRRLAGGELSGERLERALRILATVPAAEVARRLELDVERVRLLPAGILVLGALARLLGLTPRIARGGLREGVILELIDASGPVS